LFIAIADFDHLVILQVAALAVLACVVVVAHRSPARKRHPQPLLDYLGLSMQQPVAGCPVIHFLCVGANSRARGRSNRVGGGLSQYVIRLRTDRHGLPRSVIGLRGLTGQAPSATAARMLLSRSGAKSGLGELLGAVEFRRDHGVIGCVLHIESGIVGFHVVD